jgi:3-oxoacyl-[acyl-carrier protein] reductase
VTPTGEHGWVIVSGAGGALGSSITQHFATGGRRVLALDRQISDPNELDPAQVVIAQVDGSNEADIRETIDRVIKDQPIALLVNAIGRIWSEPCLSIKGAKFVTHSTDSWRAVIDANLTAPFITANVVAAKMVRARGGVIVNFSSVASAGNPGQAAYSAAKAGVEAWTRSMAAELGPLGIRVNAVALGFIDVKTTRAALSDSRLRDYVARTPVGRMGQISDVIGALEFLESNSFVNGAILKLDGGFRL